MSSDYRKSTVFVGLAYYDLKQIRADLDNIFFE